MKSWFLITIYSISFWIYSCEWRELNTAGLNTPEIFIEVEAGIWVGIDDDVIGTIVVDREHLNGTAELS